MTTLVFDCDDHKCRFNNYHEFGNLRNNSCQFSEIRIVGGMCNKRKGVDKK